MSELPSRSPLRMAFQASLRALEDINPDTSGLITECFSRNLIDGREKQKITGVPYEKMTKLLEIIVEEDAKIARFLALPYMRNRDEVVSIWIRVALNTEVVIKPEPAWVGKVIDDFLKLDCVSKDERAQAVEANSTVPSDRTTYVYDNLVAKKADPNFFRFLDLLERHEQRAKADKLEELCKIDMYTVEGGGEEKDFCFTKLHMSKVLHRRTEANGDQRMYFRIQCDKGNIEDIKMKLQQLKEALSENRSSQNHMKKVFIEKQTLIILSTWFDANRIPRGTIPEEAAKKWIEDVAIALKEIHNVRLSAEGSKQAYHGNIRPKNVIRVRQIPAEAMGPIKLLNFGIREFLLNKEFHHSKPDCSYHAPEVIERKDVSSASDIWSLGAIAYHLLTGTNLCAKDKKDIKKPGNCSKTFWTLIKQMLRETPEERPSAEDVIKELHARPDNWYSIRSNEVRGKLLLLNVAAVENKGTREGSKKDRDAMKTVFKAKFHLDEHRPEIENSDNPTADDIRKAVQQFTVIDHTNYDYAAIVVMSHGEEGILLGSDGKPVQIQAHIIDPIAGCSTLVDKPKLFLFQSCREEGQTAHFPTPSQPDVIVALATLKSQVANRDTDCGSIFIQAVNTVFENDSGEDDVLTMLTTVNGVMKKSGQQVAEIRYTTTKRFYCF